MIQPLITLPFVIPDIYAGFAEAQGIIRIEDNTLILEFVIRDSLVGLLKSGVKEIRIPISEIVSVTLNKGWFKISLIIRTQKLSSLGNLPKQEAGQIKLSLLREDGEIAEKLALFLRLKISEEKLNLLDGTYI
ncbi:hypothetical protein H6G76_30115 [Nostoc sp. FACHB-152]|uniref:hypothetical protein n=1 Tax=unclassified Nostoc TaxID=2593658 RepID=UPI0016866B2D|nr:MULTISPECIES: hypothetical protein [unclassified Nostoc]MBD2451308.1 hypothetical protein [Nostoc sp. FACHB-152]MBD2471266.1 hypothetical protein [Nostoc sp. FACHB-145]